MDITKNIHNRDNIMRRCAKLQFMTTTIHFLLIDSIFIYFQYLQESLC